MANLVLECDALMVYFPRLGSKFFASPDSRRLNFPVSTAQLLWFKAKAEEIAWAETRRLLGTDYAKQFTPEPQHPMAITPVNGPLADNMPRISVDDEFFRLGLEQG